MSRTRSDTFCFALSGSSAGGARDRGGIGLQSEQARADLVMQFERGAPPFVVLRRDQPAIEPQVFRARRFERQRERVEAVGDGGQLARR